MTTSGSGLLIVLSGPSGVGKGTVCKALRSRMPELVYSVSATTRAPRAGEREGTDYFFRTREQFLEMIRGDALLEYTEYVGNFYGTPREFVERTLAEGKDIILEIDVAGARQVKEKFPRGIFVFLLPPSFEALKERIAGRGTEPPEIIAHRLVKAAEEVARVRDYQYAVVNDDIEACCARIQAIITAEHCRTERVPGSYFREFERMTSADPISER